MASSILAGSLRRATPLAFAIASLSYAATPLAVASTSDVSADDVASIVGRMARTYAASTQGILGVRSSSDLRIEAPVFRRTIRARTWFVFRDGRLVRSSDAPDPRQPPLHDPYRAEYLGEYRYASTACASCAAGEISIGFESAAHDVAHAYGSLVVERATGRIVSSTETPYKLPWPTTGGSLNATWGPVAGTWLPTGIRGEFVGRIGPFVGHAHYRQDLTEYARYASVSDAARSLETPPVAESAR